MLSNPLYHIYELASQSLIGINDQVDQDEYGDSIAITLGDGVRPCSGEFLSFNFTTRETGTGAILSPAGTLFLLDMDPAATAGDAALAAGTFGTIIGRIDVSATDWITDANGGNAYIPNKPIPFHNLQTVYAVWFHEDATSFNDGAGDDEYLSFNAWYRRDS